MNTQAKAALLSALARLGVRWVLLRTDERNERSARAILKLRSVTEMDRWLESHIQRPDGSRRVSRMFRVDLMNGSY